MTAASPLSAPPTVLLFGPLDPTAATHLLADTQTCMAAGCHPVGVMTAVQIQDTTGLEHISLIAPEQIHDQMRCLLEDLSVHAIKAGPLYSIEEASILGQVLADYAHLPLILHLQSIPEDKYFDTEMDSGEVIDALFQLVVPFAQLVVADQLLLEQWQAEGHLDQHRHPAQELIELGAGAVLYTTTQDSGQGGSYQLFMPQGLKKQWPQQSPPERTQDTEGMLACMCAAQMAQQKPLSQACSDALQFVQQATRHIFQAGMGNRLINQSALARTQSDLKVHEA